MELKKLNAGLAKVPPIDTLIIDTYASLYKEIVPTLITIPSLTRSAPPIESINDAKPLLDIEKKNVMSLNNLINDEPTTTAEQANPVSTTVTSTNVASETQTRAKAKAVGRRELQRKAEAAAMKPNVLSSSTGIPIRNQTRCTDNVSIVIEVKADSKSGAAADESGQGTRASVFESSAPGSVHDSADESELSELDEEVEIPSPQPIFPGLAKAGKHENADDDMEA